MSIYNNRDLKIVNNTHNTSVILKCIEKNLDITKTLL